MKLNRPIIFLDIEATGSDATRDRIVEIALIKRMPDGSLEERAHRVNPGVRIPIEATAIHNISNEDVASSPAFREIAPALLDFMKDCDLGGFGISRFDIPILVEEFKRAGFPFTPENCALVDGLAIYHQKEPRNLSAAYQFYCQKTLVGAHGARADAMASMEVLFSQLERYPDLPKDAAGLHTFCNKQNERFVDSQRKFMWKDGEAAFNFGKHKGELLRTMVRDQRDYIEWVVSEGKFPQEMVDICWRALRGEFPKNEKAQKANGSKAG